MSDNRTNEGGGPSSSTVSGLGESRQNFEKNFEIAGFIQRVDIKGGITGTIAHFKYIGDDPELKLLADLSGGYILLKMPSQSNLDVNHPDFHISHAAKTFLNEIENSNTFATKPAADKCPKLLVKEIGGITYIAMQPIYCNKEEFLKKMKAIQEREQQIHQDIDTAQASNKTAKENLLSAKSELDSKSKELKDQRSQYSKDNGGITKAGKTPEGKAVLDKFNYEIKEVDAAIKELTAKIKIIESSNHLNQNPDANNPDLAELKKLREAEVKNSFRNLRDYMESLGERSDTNIATIDNIFSGMLNSQAEVHTKKDAIHNDTAVRNFVVGDDSGNADVHCVDFGASQSCNTDGVVPETKTFPIEPIYNLNQAAIPSQDNKRTLNIPTDHFALKIAMMEAIGYFSGVGSEKEIREMQMVENGVRVCPNTMIDDLKYLKTASDESRLNRLFNNLRQHIATLDADDPRKKVAMEAIQKYRSLLTKVLPANLSKDDAVSQNREAFERCKALTVAPREAEQARFSAIQSKVTEVDKAAAAINPSKPEPPPEPHSITTIKIR